MNQYHTYYTFQHRRVAESPWLKKEPILPIKKKDEWSFSCFDYFGKAINCLKWLDGGSVKYAYKGGSECHDVWSKTGSKGFWTLKYAKEALNRLKEFNSKGKFDTVSGYHEHEQSVRYEFRIVKVTCFDDIVEVVS